MFCIKAWHKLVWQLSCFVIEDYQEEQKRNSWTIKYYTETTAKYDLGEARGRDGSKSQSRTDQRRTSVSGIHADK